MNKIWLKNYPDDIPHDISPIHQSLDEIFLDTCETYKDRDAFINFDKRLSYSELKQLSMQLGAYLQSQGLKQGDTIAIQLPNLLQYPVSLWASLLSGLTVVNINPLYTATEMKYQLQEAEVKACILFSMSAKNLETIYPELPHLKTIIVTEPGDLLSFPKKQIVNFVFKHIKKSVKKYNIPNSISFTKAVQHSSQNFKIIKRDLEDTCFIQYTGGTTGVSKGACLTQRNIISNMLQAGSWIASALKTKGGKSQDMVLTPLPLYHIFSFLVNGLSFFTKGATNVLVTNPRDLSSVIKTLKKYPITVGTTVNTLSSALLKDKRFKELDFKDWKFFVAGGMPLKTETAELWKKITHSPIIEGYGLTEASPVVCCNLVDNIRLNSIGLPFPSTDIRIADSNDQALPINTEGELQVKGPQVMKGYYKNEKESAHVFSSDGWLKTGDIGMVDDDGFVFIKGRLKDMINISGLKVYPDEVENILIQNDKIKDIAIVGGLHNGEEIVRAFVVKQDPDLTEEEFKKYCKQNLAAYKIPKEIHFIDEIPKTNIGKNLRRALK